MNTIEAARRTTAACWHEPTPANDNARMSIGWWAVPALLFWLALIWWLA